MKNLLIVLSVLCLLTFTSTVNAGPLRNAVRRVVNSRPVQVVVNTVDRVRPVRRVVGVVRDVQPVRRLLKKSARVVDAVVSNGSSLSCDHCSCQ